MGRPPMWRKPVGGLRPRRRCQEPERLGAWGGGDGVWDHGGPPFLLPQPTGQQGMMRLGLDVDEAALTLALVTLSTSKGE